MGSPKAVLGYQGKTFLEIIISELKKAGIKEIIVVLGKDKDKIFEKWKPSNEKVIFNDKPELGQIHSLRLALAESGERDIMICLADQPLIKFETYKKISDFFFENKNSIVIPKCLKEYSPGDIRYKRGHPIIIPNIYKKLCFEGPIEKGLHWVTHHSGVKVLDVEVSDGGILKDFDTPQDYFSLKR